jgi:hypothetical protein
MRPSDIIRSIFFILLLLNQYVALSQPFIPGNTYYGRNNYIEYIAGNFPIIISVPHGGALTPAEISDRTCGDETVTDSYTISLAREISNSIYQVTGCYPHIIICNLKRTKLDANRDLPEAACGNQYAETAWYEFHKFLDSAKLNVEKKSGKGLYIDLHGHGHAIQRLELGYLLTAAQLRYSDATLNTPTYTNISSILNLINNNVTSLTHSDLLRGVFSLGSMFAAKGFPSVPGSDDPYPLIGQSYFSGGYNTQRHGSKNGGSVDAIQIECNQDVRFVESDRLDFASKTALLLIEYLKKHYFPDLTEKYCKPVGIEPSLNERFIIFPNPFENVIYFHNSIPASLNIFDFQGKKVYSGKIGYEDKIEIGYLKDGIYLVTLSVNGKILHSEKIIKVYYFD